MASNVPSSLALTSIADGAAIVAADHRNNYAGIQTAVNALITLLDEADAKGDLLVASGADAYDNLTVGANGKALIADSAQTLGLKWDYPPGYQFTRDSFTTAVTSSATSEGTATTVKASTSVTFDGSTEIGVEFYAPWVTHSASGSGIILVLFEDSTVIGEILRTQTVTAGDRISVGTLRHFRTPAAGAHTYTVKVWGSAGTATVQGGAGGTGVAVAGFIRVVKV